jgi:hypothetical protein
MPSRFQSFEIERNNLDPRRLLFLI